MLASLLLAICKLSRTRCLSISTVIADKYKYQLDKLGFEPVEFPFSPQDYLYSAERIEKLAIKIRSNFDFLDSLKMKTQSWFTSDHPHISHDIHLNKLAQHKRVVQEVWPWFPNTWCNTYDSARNLHENLKCLCGVTSCWMSPNSKDVRPLSVGAAYLLLLIAMEHHFPGWLKDNSECSIKEFDKMSDATTRLLACQERSVAEKSIRSLYNLFLAVGVHKKDGTSAIDSIVFDPPGRRLKVNLKWSAQEKLSKDGLETLENIKDSIALPPSGKTLRALLDFMMLSKINENGFGCPASLYLERGTLIIGL